MMNAAILKRKAEKKSSTAISLFPASETLTSTL